MNAYSDLDFSDFPSVKERVVLARKLLMKSKIAYALENKEDSLMVSGLSTRESRQLSDRVGLMASIQCLAVLSHTYFRYSRHTKIVESFSEEDEENEEVGGRWTKVTINGRTKKRYCL
jgi:hypothetical protein